MNIRMHPQIMQAERLLEYFRREGMCALDALARATPVGYLATAQSGIRVFDPPFLSCRLGWQHVLVIIVGGKMFLANPDDCNYCGQLGMWEGM
jgi:hypothetical protein